MTTILVIEDQPDVRENLEDSLIQAHYRVLSATDGEVGLILAQSHQPDLIVCDVTLSKLSNQSVYSALREDPLLVSIPTIFLLTKTDCQDFLQQFPLDTGDYLLKPINSAVLLPAIAARLAPPQPPPATVDGPPKSRNGGQPITRPLPHELLTPLHTILDSTDAILKVGKRPPQDMLLESIQEIKTSSEQLQRLMQNFLLLADLNFMASHPTQKRAWSSASGMESVTLPGALQPVVNQRAHRDQREADIILLCDPVTVNIPPPDFEKIVSEIIDNALKFSLAGTPILITARAELGALVLSFQDQGRGMRPETLNAIMDDSPPSDTVFYEHTGPGLGLPVAKKLVEFYGGTLAIASEMNRGTTVMITALPCEPLSPSRVG